MRSRLCLIVAAALAMPGPSAGTSKSRSKPKMPSLPSMPSMPSLPSMPSMPSMPARSDEPSEERGERKPGRSRKKSSRSTDSRQILETLDSLQDLETALERLSSEIAEEDLREAAVDLRWSAKEALEGIDSGTTMRSALKTFRPILEDLGSFLRRADGVSLQPRGMKALGLAESCYEALTLLAREGGGR